MRKLNQFLSGTRSRPPLTRDLANTFAHQDHPEFSRVTRLAVANLQSRSCEKRQKRKKTPKKAWGPCQRLKDYAKGMGTMQKAWEPCQRHGDHAKGMEVMVKALRPCQGHGNNAKGIKSLPKAQRPCQRQGDHSMVTLPMAW